MAIVFMDSVLNTSDSIFKSDGGSNISKIVIKDFTYFIVIYDSIVAFLTNHVIATLSMLVSHKRGDGFPEGFVLFNASLWKIIS